MIKGMKRKIGGILASAMVLCVMGSSAFAQYALPSTTTSAEDVATAGGDAAAELIAVLVGFVVVLGLMKKVGAWFASRRTG